MTEFQTDELVEVIETTLAGIPKGVKVAVEPMVVVTNGNNEYLGTIYPTTKCVEWCEEIRQTGHTDRVLRPLLDYLEEQGYSTDLK